jgi:anti-sigma factor RsiW
MRMIEPGPPSEQDLHAYIDGHLEPAEASRVAAYLARHPETAALVEAYRAQTAGLHALYDKILDEPVPQEMLALLRHRRSATTWRGVALAAAALALIMVSTGMGWWLNDLRRGSAAAAPAALVAEAQRAHRLFAGDEPLVSDFGTQRSTGLAQSLSQRIGAAVTLPDVERAGLSLRGVRLVPTASGTAAVLLYRDNAGRPASLFVTTIAAADAPPQIENSADVVTLYRVAGGLAYALTLPRAPGADAAIKIAFGMQTSP